MQGNDRASLHAGDNLVVFISLILGTDRICITPAPVQSVVWNLPVPLVGAPSVS